MRERPAWRWIGLFVVVKIVAHAVAIPGYGYFRDELYYLACADHLAWGYVDHPPLSIAALDVLIALFGDSLWALRLGAATLGAMTLALVGWIAFRLGGKVQAQVLAMSATLIAPMLLALTGFYSMNAWSLLLWTLVAAILVHILNRVAPQPGRRRPRPATGSWLLLGLVLGLGLLNKVDVLWLGAGLGVGLLLAGRHFLQQRGPWLAGGVAMLVFAPHLWWQHVHGWPTLEFVRNASADKMQTVAPVDFLLDQIMSVHPSTLPIWLGGLIFLLLMPSGRPFRVLGWIYPTVLLILVLNGTSRSGYLAGAYPLLFAAGGVAWERWLNRLSFGRVVGWLMVAGMLVTGAWTLPLVLPVLPVERYIEHARDLGIEPSTAERKEVGPLPQHYADMHGWPELATTVAGVLDSLSDAERQRTVILASNYGQAGALLHFLGDEPLPKVASGHNNFWLWGPGLDNPEVLVVIGSSREAIEPFARSVTLGARTDCGRYCMPYENDVPIWVVREVTVPLGEAWPELKHFD